MKDRLKEVILARKQLESRLNDRVVGNASARKHNQQVGGSGPPVGFRKISN